MGRPHPGGLAQVGRGAVVRGRLAGKGALLVHGTLRGEVSLEGDLVVAAGGHLGEGRVRAGRLRVEGRAEGAFRILGPLEITAGGEVRGEVEAARLDASPDGLLDARLRVGFPRPGPGPS